MTLLFDIETNGLLENVDTIHCLVIRDVETKKTLAYNDQGNQEPISRGLQRLQDSDCIIGHNIIGYDLPVIHKLYDWFREPGMVVDTLLLSRIYHADMMKLDGWLSTSEGINKELLPHGSSKMIKHVNEL